MMSIYRISHNIEDFMFFTIDDLDVYDKMEGFDIDGFGQPLTFAWVAPKAEFIPSDSGSEIEPDITQWNGSDLILNSKAKQALEHILKDVGDFLPLAGACKDHWMFNPTTRMGNDIIDTSKTTSAYFDDGSWEKLESLGFNERTEQLAPCLFTLEIDRSVNLYCSDAFKTALEKNALQGLNVEKVS